MSILKDAEMMYLEGENPAAVTSMSSKGRAEQWGSHGAEWLQCCILDVLSD